MKKVLLEDRVNLEPYAEETDAKDPLRRVFDDAPTVRDAVTGAIDHLEELRLRYPDFFDFEYVCKTKGYGNGARSEWFELWGIPLGGALNTKKE